MAVASSKKVTGWLWIPVGDDQTHPGETPRDEKLAAKRWVENVRGPKLSRIRQVGVLLDRKAAKANHVCVQDGDVVREVPKHMVLHEREGFLIIQELLRIAGDATSLHADWVDANLRALFENHAQGKTLSSAQYVQKILMKKAVTGVRFFDANQRESSFRRDLQDNEGEHLSDGEEADGMFKIKDVVGYMPPWEAFCHGKCGFYQDFYKVQWAHPYSELDYSQVENGCQGELGATWEPDENLPSCLDFHRIKSKRAWYASQIERETKAKRGPPQPVVPDAKKLRQAPLSVKKELDDEEEKKLEPAQFRRNAEPLDRDIFRFHIGHDLVPKAPEDFPSIRQGWPLHAKDYPPGFGVANPPGYCWENCDCMDDQRGQRDWEVTKRWIDASRGIQAKAAIDSFSQETSMVRTRGSVSRTYYFETSQAAPSFTPQQRAAVDFSVTFQGALRQACMTIPIRELIPGADPVYLPSRAILSIRENSDYVPICIDANLESGAALPPFIKLDAVTGRLSISSEHNMSFDIRIQLQFKFYEGTVKTFNVTIAMEEAPPLLDHIKPVIAQLNDHSFQLDPVVKLLIDENLTQIYDSTRGAMRQCSLGKFIETLTTCQNMLRAVSVANLLPPSVRSRYAPRV